jgi:hypothetical protein
MTALRQLWLLLFQVVSKLGSIRALRCSHIMCEKCIAIDAKIARYQRLLDGVDDLVAITLVSVFISDLESEKAALHPGAAEQSV